MNKIVVGVLLVAGMLAGRAADAATCDGPAECCPAEAATKLAKPASVGLGMVIVGLYNVNEKAGTWDADYYLYESWVPQEGFTPQTEIVNESARLSEQFDTVELRGPAGQQRCLRSRRLRSTLHSNFNLKMFPFDRQGLTMQLSDAKYDVTMESYDDKPYVAGLDDSATEQLSQWKISGALQYQHVQRAFKWEEGAPTYDYATFTLPVSRYMTFHLTKFFLPLFVIVIISMAVFWIDPEDLSSQIGVGVTCLLAAIAFQLSQASTLPEVAYLTLADRVYVICYLSIAVALAESVYCNALSRRGQKERAVRVDKLCRVGFPAAMLFAIGVSAIIAKMQS